MLRVPFSTQGGRLAAVNKLCSSANNIQIMQGNSQKQPSKLRQEESKATFLARSLHGGRGLDLGEPPEGGTGGGGRGLGEGKGEDPARRGGGAQGSAAPPPWAVPQGTLVALGHPGPWARWPQARSGTKGAGGPGGPCQGGAPLRGPRGGPAHRADAHGRSDTHPALFIQHPAPWSPAAILRQGPLSPGSRAGQVTLPQEGPAPAGSPAAGSVGSPRRDAGAARGERDIPAEPGTPGPLGWGPGWGGRGASVELRWPGARGGGRGLGTSSEKGDRVPGGLPFPSRCPALLTRAPGQVDCHFAERLALGAHLSQLRPPRAPGGCPPAALSSSRAGSTLGPCTDVVANPHDGHFPRLGGKTCASIFL